jgi:hypothetical protein
MEALSSSLPAPTITNKLSKRDLIEAIYDIISKNSGRVRAVDLLRVFENNNKQDVRSAIARLTTTGRITRKRGFGASGIEYFYYDTHAKLVTK